MANDIFFKLNYPAKKLENFIVFDTENNPENGEFILGCAIKHDIIYEFYDKQNMINFLFNANNRDYKIFAHNAMYDLTVLLDDKIMLFFDPEKFALKGNRLLFAVHKNGNSNICFFDTFNHSFCSLATIGKLYGMKKTPGFDMQHCIMDCKILNQYVKDCSELYYDNNCSFKATIAGTSLDLYRRNFWKGPGYKKISESNLEFMKKAYFGGLTDCYFVGKKKGIFYQYDINSQYPYIMANTKFPIIASMKYETKLEIDKDGISEVELEVPENCNIFPVRMGRTRKIYFPYGFINGIFTHNLLREGLEKGLKIL